MQLLNRWKIFAIYALTLLMYTVASPDLNPNECNSTLMSTTREEMLTPNPNECNSTLTSGTSGGAAPPIPYRLGKGVNYITLTSAILH